MGIGHQPLSLFEEMIDQNLIAESKSVMEMGSQIIDKHYQVRAKERIKNETIKNKNFISAKDFYLGIGFTEYNAIDSDGEHESLIFDLNKNIKEHYNYNQKFDLVTNFGTSEHVFNQKNFFENVHDMTKKDGLMLHLLPFEGYFNHGFFNYQPSFIYDLALFNRYEILGFWYFSEKSLQNLTHYYGCNYHPLKYHDDLIKYLDKLAEENKLPGGGSPLRIHSSLGVLYKKKKDIKFQDPFQSIYNKTIKVKEYILDHVDDVKVDHIYNFNKNVDQKKQIDDALGGGYWKIKIKKLFLDHKFRIKLFRKILSLFGSKSAERYKKYYWRFFR